MDMDLIINNKEYSISDFEYMDNANQIFDKIFDYFLQAYNLQKTYLNDNYYKTRSSIEDMTKKRRFKEKYLKKIKIFIDGTDYSNLTISECLVLLQSFIDTRRHNEIKETKRMNSIIECEFDKKIKSLTIEQKQGLLSIIEGLSLLK